MRLSIPLAILAVFGVCAAPIWAAEPQTLDELLQSVIREQQSARQRNTEREQRFATARDQQAQMLEQARSALAAEQARGEQLKATYAANEVAMGAQRQENQDATGELGDFQGVVRQIATDAKAMLDASLVSAQLSERLGFVEQLSQGEGMPTLEEVERLWQILLEEIVASGKVMQFEANVITAEGSEEQRTVTRMGVFNATSDGKFLRYAPEINQLVEPARQPTLVYQRMARKLEQAEQGMTTVAFDPTRGSMLAILAQEPTLWERIKQGRLVGFLIIGLGAIALVIAIWKFFVLASTGRRIARQQREREPNEDNPLGRIMKTWTQNRNVDAETLELKLDDAILRELPPLQRGLGALVVIAEASPLLGLLGTVSGMVATFQALSLFGTGDAKVVAGGISEALVATIIGLCVAIPSLVVHSFLKSRSDELVQILDEQAAGMVAHMAEAHHQREQAAHHTTPHLVKN
jgi:biopolymer transport protein ExbB